MFPDLFPGAGRDKPISGAKLCHQNLLILRCIFSPLCCIFPTLCPPAPRHVFDPRARDASGKFRLFQVRNGSSPAIQDLGHEGAGMPTPLPQHQLKLRGRFRAHRAAYRFIAYQLLQPSRRAGRSWCCRELYSSALNYRSEQVNDSAMTQQSSSPEHTQASTTSPNPIQDNRLSPTMLSRAEIESLRQEAKESLAVIGSYLRELKAKR